MATRQVAGQSNTTPDDNTAARLVHLNQAPNPELFGLDDADQTIREQRQLEQQPLDVFIKHVTRQQQLEMHERDRRASLPVDVIELPTLSGVVMRRKQQLQSGYQQLEQQHQQLSNNQQNNQALLPNNSNTIMPATKGGRPLSISSVSSAASSGSSSSANSSASSGIHSSLTRNGSLNYGHEFRKQAYLASVESLNNPSGCSNQNDTQASLEADMKQLNLSTSTAITRAAVIAAGSQTRGFNHAPDGRLSRINRSLHASLRYDKNMAYRIQLMANARALLNQSSQVSPEGEEQKCNQISISRNNSSTSSDSSQNQNRRLNLGARTARFVCSCGASPSLTLSSSASQVEQSSGGEKDERESAELTNKAATLDSATIQRSVVHHPDCFLSREHQKQRKASSKLQPSPSSASSHSNTSSLFRDDGFEDDLNSTVSEQASSHHHHRLSFQGSRIHHQRNYLHYCISSASQNSSSRAGDNEEDYQSCEEEFSNSHTTASTTSNIDDCALSTTSSSVIHSHEHHQQILDKISLANAKQQYRKSLLLEHQQQQHLLHSQHVGQSSKIQALLSTSPSLCRIGSLSPNCTNTNLSNSTTSANTTSSSQAKQSKCDDRTVNIIGHMPTRSPGYWDSNLSITQRVVTEIIETERAYVEDLEQIVTGYICYLRNVLKQQKTQQHHLNTAENHKQQRRLSSHSAKCDSNTMVNRNTTSQNSATPSNNNTSNNNDDDDKSMLVFDDDTTSATNEIEDYDVEDADTDNIHQTSKNMNQQQQVTSEHRESCNDAGAIMTANHIKKLFSNLEDIYKFNKDLLFRLEECYLNPSSVAECFVENASGFEVYTHYCTMYPQVVSTLTELMGNQTSAQLLKERQSELDQSLPLGAYLLKPVQRILKYHILFQSLIKHTADDDSVNEKDHQLINEAFSVMTNIACHINAMKKRHEHAIRVQEVQGLLSGWEGPDLTTLGELILEDTFKLYNRPKSTRHLFLFDNVLLITKKKRDGSLCYKGHIACSNLMLIERIEGQPLVFNTVPFDNPKALCAFQAKNLDKKRDWCLQMKEVIIKSFEVKIPVHVRDILMSLTNNSITTNVNMKQSSESAKTIRAPNYLEKKRAKHDKKSK